MYIHVHVHPITKIRKNMKCRERRFKGYEKIQTKQRNHNKNNQVNKQNKEETSKNNELKRITTTKNTSSQLLPN